MMHVLLLGGNHGPVGDGERAVERHQRTADLGIRRRINLTTLGAGKEIVNHVKSALAVVSSGIVIAYMLCSRRIKMGLAEVESIVGRWLWRIVTTGVRAGLRESSTAASHLAIMVVVTWR